MLNIGVHSYLETYEDFKEYACKCNTQPKSLCTTRNTLEVVKEIETVDND